MGTHASHLPLLCPLQVVSMQAKLLELRGQLSELRSTIPRLEDGKKAAVTGECGAACLCQQTWDGGRAGFCYSSYWCGVCTIGWLGASV